jgi:hypothetical protein
MAQVQNEQVSRLLSHGSELAGAAVGGAVGFFAAGPAGAAGAGALSAALPVRPGGATVPNESAIDGMSVGAG